MTTDLRPELRTVDELFGSDDSTFVVPIYQRNYAWGAEQIEQLISDVLDALQEGDSTYFLGNLIVTERGGREGQYEVIDGQQRLTTLFLLLTALRGSGTIDFQDHHDRLHYESRPRAAEVLRRLTTEASRHAGTSAGTFRPEDTGIHEGYNVICQFLDQHPSLRGGADRDEFADYLRTRVTVVRAALPPKTDLNRYFEVMNTRGQQLQQVDIVKARLMSHLDDEADRACFAWIWDSCSEMDAYVQMSLTRGSPDVRASLFGDTWSWLQACDFDDLLRAHGVLGGEGESSLELTASMSIGDAITRYAAVGARSGDDDAEGERFRSTIDYSAFLLHVLKVLDSADDEEDGQLDDKRLVSRFDSAVSALKSGEARRWVHEFAVALLRLRNLFDGFILKRQYVASRGDEGDWSMQRLVRRTSQNRPTPGYVTTLAAERAGDEEPPGADLVSPDLLILQSMLRVTYTSPRTMHWITKVLAHLDRRDAAQIDGSELVELLRDHARRKVRESLDHDQVPEGFGISRIVFTYIDYLLLGSVEKSSFRFGFRTSIEHFYPRHPDEQQSGAEVSAECLDLLGNLALVSVSANSKFSNSLPRAKAENYRLTIEAQSPKLRLMAEATRHDHWGDAQVRQHHQKMVELLMGDLSGAARNENGER